MQTRYNAGSSQHEKFSNREFSARKEATYLFNQRGGDANEEKIAKKKKKKEKEKCENVGRAGDWKEEKERISARNLQRKW